MGTVAWRRRRRGRMEAADFGGSSRRTCGEEEKEITGQDLNIDAGASGTPLLAFLACYLVLSVTFLQFSGHGKGFTIPIKSILCTCTYSNIQ